MKPACSRIIGALIFGISVGVAGCTVEAPQSGQTTGQPAAAQAAGGQASELADLLKDWQEQKATMTKIADAMPENKFGYKSTPPQRSYGEQIMHAALTNVEMLKAISGKTAPPSFTAESAKTKTEILKALADSYDYGIALLNEQTDATINQTVLDFLGPSTRGRIFWSLLAHSMDVYGQMAVYLRLNGIVPPASRNP